MKKQFLEKNVNSIIVINRAASVRYSGNSRQKTMASKFLRVRACLENATRLAGAHDTSRMRGHLCRNGRKKTAPTGLQLWERNSFYMGE